MDNYSMIKGYELAAYISEINLLISSLGMGYSFFNDDQSCLIFSSVGIGVNIGLFLYDTYQVWSLNKTDHGKSRKMITSSKQYMKSLYQK